MLRAPKRKSDVYISLFLEPVPVLQFFPLQLAGTCGGILLSRRAAYARLVTADEDPFLVPVTRRTPVGVDAIRERWGPRGGSGFQNPSLD